jgi:hypothetical protein
MHTQEIFLFANIRKLQIHVLQMGEFCGEEEPDMVNNKIIITPKY